MKRRFVSVIMCLLFLAVAAGCAAQEEPLIPTDSPQPSPSAQPTDLPSPTPDSAPWPEGQIKLLAGQKEVWWDPETGAVTLEDAAAEPTGAGYELEQSAGGCTLIQDGTRTLFSLAERPAPVQGGDAACWLACVMTPGIQEWLPALLEDLVFRHIFDGPVNMRIGIPLINSSAKIVDDRFFSYDEYIAVKNLLLNGNYSNVTIDSLPAFSRIRAMVLRDINSRANCETRVCKNGEKTPLAVGPNGNVYWCLCEDPSAGIIGNYNTGKINYELLRDLRLRNIFTISECRNCDMRYICASGCPTPLFAAGQATLSPSCRELNNEYLVDRMEAFIL